MRSKSLLSLFAIAALTLSLGCGGGGGGGTSAPVKTDTVISGVIAAPAGSVLGTRRAASGDGFNYSNLKVIVSGTDVSVSPDSSGAFSLTLTSLSNTYVDLIVKNTAGDKTFFGKRIFNVFLGEDVSGTQTLDATSTALLKIARLNPTYSEAEIEWLENHNAGLKEVVDQFIAFLRDSSLSDIFSKDVITSSLAQFGNGSSEIRTAYENMGNIMESNNLATATRIDNFMKYFASTFVDTTGALSFDDLHDSTASRFDRYTVNAYSLQIRSMEYGTSTDTIKVETRMYGSLTKKTGASGNVSQATGYITKTADGSNPVITWKYIGSAWKIISGFPFRTSEPYSFGSVSFDFE